MKKFRELKEEVSTPPIGVRSLYTKMYANMVVLFLKPKMHSLKPMQKLKRNMAKRCVIV
jgi:hypothetical protein